MNWLNNKAIDAINVFWKLAGEIEEFPRSLERPLALALPVALIKLPHLQLGSIERWLRSRGVHYTFNCQNRSVRGCLVAFRGLGIIFVDGADPIEQLRFTVAHEIAHFLVDYWLPRIRSIESFGQSITEALDGIRSASIDERIHSVFSGVPIGFHLELMEREYEKNPMGEVWKVEDQADKVALALLAPPDDVLTTADISGDNFELRTSSMRQALQTAFGLPSNIAEGYAWGLLSSIGRGPSWSEALRRR